MKILVLAGKVPDTQSLSSGWLNAFLALGHEGVAWHSGMEPAFDTFDRVMPELVWVHGRDLSRDGVKAIIGEKLKTILFVSNYSDASEQEKKFVEQLVRAGHQLAFNTSFPSKVEVACEGWKGIGLTVLSCLPAADITKFKSVEFNSNHASVLSFIGCYEGIKEKNLNQYILPLTTKYDLKIYGYGNWPVANYLGHLSRDMINTVICSTKFNLSVSGENSTGPSERIFKILACGKIPFVHLNSAHEDYSALGVEIHFFGDKCYIEECVKNDKFETVTKTDVICKHRYQDRVQEVFSILGVKG